MCYKLFILFQIMLRSLIFIAVLLAQIALAAPLVNFNDTWRYRKGTSAPQTDWKTADDSSLDASWLSGPGWIGYGDGSGANAAGTTLTDMVNTYRTFLVRKTFTVPPGTPATDEIVIQVDYDDGFIAWINGTRVDNQPAALTSELAFNDTTTTVASHEASFGNSSPQSVRTTVLGTVGAVAPAGGTYVLAVQLANQNLTSSDAVLKVNLFTQTPPPPPDLRAMRKATPMAATATPRCPASSSAWLPWRARRQPSARPRACRPF